LQDSEGSRDELDVIGAGHHERAIIDVARFAARAETQDEGRNGRRATATSELEH
jgi:hypothetical protein